MKTISIMLLGIVLAGCSSMTGKAPAAGTAAQAKPVQYHAQVVTEHSEGDSKFLEMVPDDSDGQ